MEAGKISQRDFGQTILAACGARRPEVSCGPAFGVDVSLVDLPAGQALAMTSDPLSLVPSLGLQESAWLSVHLMANDMATTGFAPMYAQFVLNLPPTLSLADFNAYWTCIDQYCKTLGVAITGGHTGVVPGQNSTVAGGGTMLLSAPKNQIRLSRNARAGDAIIVTKSCALSSAAILAMSFPETVRRRLGKEVYDRGCALFYQTSALPDALAVAGNPAVSAMHDVTEGGVLGAIYEMAVASGNGLRVCSDDLPEEESAAAICRLFDLDPRYCIGAGSMIIAAGKSGVKTVLADLEKQQIEAKVVGEFLPDPQEKILVENEIPGILPYSGTDPYWNAYFQALHRGWA